MERTTGRDEGEVTRPETRCGASSGRGHVLTHGALWGVLLSRGRDERNGRAKRNHSELAPLFCKKVQEGQAAYSLRTAMLLPLFKSSRRRLSFRG